MKHIDEKFKEVAPSATVEKIKGILSELGIEVEERWKDTGIDNCRSLNLSSSGGFPSSNGKGVTEEFARASAYAEFVERLQGGLFLYKYQDIIKDPEMYIQNFAPDAKYFTAAELEENGEWMDYLVNEYGGNLSRKAIVEFCKLYACTDEDKILTLPFYSLFEDKYVYLPIAFVDQVYTANGCCAGNTRNEAWVHALSEMMERRASIKMVTSGESAPAIPMSVLEKYPTVNKILNQIRNSGNFDIQILDYSLGNGFPVVSTRIINKVTRDYRVNVAADPVLEIALQRTLTEMLQGKNIRELSSGHGDRIIGKISEVSMLNNVWNQLEASNGIYTADFFAEELTCTRKLADFPDNSNKTNTELLKYMLDLYRKLGKPVYVRSFSYLGFLSYRFVVPGFSEAKAIDLQDKLPDTLASETAKCLRNIAGASMAELALFLQYSKMMRTNYSKCYDFGRFAGLPFTGDFKVHLICIMRSYAAFKIKTYNEAAVHAGYVANSLTADEKTKKYFACLSKYIELLASKVSEDKIRIILYKFFDKEVADSLYEKLDSGLSPYDDYLFKCDPENCGACKYRQHCVYTECKELIAKVGEKYKKFTDGQKREDFSIESL